jgi:ABC-type transport system involved in cytochrome c biogenesis ATPase subunit
MRKLNIGTNNYTEIWVIDEPGAGNACHKYSIRELKDSNNEFSFIKFQEGPIKENGVNGCHQEDLLAIVIDRLESFQAGKFSCRENALAITKCEEALHWLNHRTADRKKRGVEETSDE